MLPASLNFGQEKQLALENVIYIHINLCIFKNV